MVLDESVRVQSRIRSHNSRSGYQVGDEWSQKGIIKAQYAVIEKQRRNNRSRSNKKSTRVRRREQEEKKSEDKKKMKNEAAAATTQGD
jgi:hypothetical protein